MLLLLLTPSMSPVKLDVLGPLGEEKGENEDPERSSPLLSLLFSPLSPVSFHPECEQEVEESPFREWAGRLCGARRSSLLWAVPPQRERGELGCWSVPFSADERRWQNPPCWLWPPASTAHPVSLQEAVIYFVLCFVFNYYNWYVVTVKQPVANAEPDHSCADQ